LKSKRLRIKGEDGRPKTEVEDPPVGGDEIPRAKRIGDGRPKINAYRN
jgi:hypothetical protein